MIEAIEPQPLEHEFLSRGPVPLDEETSKVADLNLIKNQESAPELISAKVGYYKVNENGTRHFLTGDTIDDDLLYTESYESSVHPLNLMKSKYTSIVKS